MVRVGGYAVFPVEFLQAQEGQVCVYAVVSVLDLRAEICNRGHYFLALVISMDLYPINFLYSLMIIDASHCGLGCSQILVRLSTMFKRSFMLWMSSCSFTMSLYQLTAF